MCLDPVSTAVIGSVAGKALAPKTPAAPALQAAPPPVPTAGDPAVSATRSRSKRQSLISARSGTVSTSQKGDLSPANIDRKSLLGS